MHRPFTLRKVSLLFALALVITAAATARLAQRSHASGKRQTLTFEDRVVAQRAIETVYWRHRLWPKENTQPKPALAAVMPESTIRAKVEDYLRKSRALEVYWQRPITGEQLQAEVDRMARETKQPDVLRELWMALGNDPLVIAECLARPVLVERLAHNWYAFDEHFHGELKQRAEAELGQPDAVAQMRQMSGEYREVKWRLTSDDADNPQPTIHNQPQSEALSAEQWREQMNKLAQVFGAVLPAASEKPVPHESVIPPSAIRHPQLSALQEDEERFYALLVLEQSTVRVKVASVEWRKKSFATWSSGLREQMDMSEATGGLYRLPKIKTVGVPCGSESWGNTKTLTPDGRFRHTSIWTGNEMIVWGGDDGSSSRNTGGRYNPATDSWTPTSTAGAPTARNSHTAIWTGSEMIVWGGINSSSSGFSVLNTGGRYNPATDSWTPTSTAGAPSARSSHTAIWTGSEMIVWGGSSLTPGRYNPATDAWTPTSTAGAPSARSSHTAIWTGNEMIVWGGRSDISPFDRLNTGGRYNPATDAWTPTSTAGAPSARSSHTAIWTGNEMIVWGGINGSTALNTGGRYNPATDSWTPTSTAGAPSARSSHTAIWTGSEMIVRWNGSERPTTFVGQSRLTAAISASDIATPGIARITVFNPHSVSGGESTPLPFTIGNTLANTSAASFASTQFASESIVAAFGTQLATATEAANSLPLPTALAGTTVKVKDNAGMERLALLFFVSPAQVNYLVPAGTSAGASVVTVTSGDGKLSLGPLQIAAVAPGLFAANANGQGVAAAVALRVRGAAQTFEPVAQFDAATGRFVAAPIDLGPEGDQIILLLFGTGIRGRSALSAVTCTIGGVAVPVGFAAAAPGFVGLDQVNIGPLPRSLAGRGEVDVVLTVEGKEANRVRIGIK